MNPQHHLLRTHQLSHISHILLPVPQRTDLMHMLCSLILSDRLFCILHSARLLEYLRLSVKDSVYLYFEMCSLLIIAQIMRLLLCLNRSLPCRYRLQTYLPSPSLAVPFLRPTQLHRQQIRFVCQLHAIINIKFTATAHFFSSNPLINAKFSGLVFSNLGSLTQLMMPDLPARSSLHDAARSLASGDTIPMPVITTLLIVKYVRFYYDHCLNQFIIV